MTDTEQPSQFFLRVWLDALAVASKDAIAFKPKQDYAAAKAIQRAFAEREAELVGALRWIAANYENGHINHVDFRVEAKHRAYAALKSREAGHG